MRLYHIAERVTCLTTDHTLGEARREAGKALEQSEDDLLLQYLGCTPAPEIDIQTCTLNPGDRILVCSNGYWVQAPQNSLHRAAVLPLKSACRALIRDANANGGSDNVTALMVEQISV